MYYRNTDRTEQFMQKCMHFPGFPDVSSSFNSSSLGGKKKKRKKALVHCLCNEVKKRPTQKLRVSGCCEAMTGKGLTGLEKKLQ